MTPYLPSVDFEVFLSSFVSMSIDSKENKGGGKDGTHLGKIRRDNRAIRKLPPSQRLQRLARRIRIVVLDEDLADAVGLPAAAAGAGHLHLEHGAILFALFLDVFADFCFV